MQYYEMWYVNKWWIYL